MTRTFAHSPLDFRSMPPVIRLLIAANVIAFVLGRLVGLGQFFDLFGLVPAHIVRDRWVWQPFTYLFLHADIVHLLFNLLSLWMFAMPVEAQWGPREFARYYLLCGVGAGLFHAALAPHSTAPVVGASGAIYGLLVAFAMLYPDAVVYLYFFFPIRARHMAILFGLLEFFAGATSTTPGYARFAHLGGMLIGYLYIRWWWEIQVRAKGIWRGWAGPREVPGRRREAAVRGAKGSGRPPEYSDEEVDRILDKISAHGSDSLSEEERDLLRRASQRRKPEGHA